MTKKVIALFDVDGTLTVPRKQITPGKCVLVQCWCGGVKIELQFRNGTLHAKTQGQSDGGHRWRLRLL